MKYIMDQTIYEAVTNTRIICYTCGHSWPIADGGDDLYICHICYHDNNPSNTLK